MLFITWTIIIALNVVLFGSFNRVDIVDWLIHYWAYYGVKFYGIEVQAFGRENLPRGGKGALLVFNHQSHFDILAIHRVADITLRFGAKIELFKIPLFGRSMRIAGALPIVRDNRVEVFKVYKESEGRIAKGDSFVLAPEGTRQPTPKVGVFKKGPFMFAVNAKAQIVPTVVVGSLEVLSKKSLLPNVGQMKRVIEVHFMKPVDTAGRESEVPALTNEVQALMSALFDERRKLLYPAR